MIIVLIIIIFFIVLWLIPGFTRPIKIPGSIASLEKVKLGGQDQWILIRGVDKTNPVILFLHGGPGTADMCLLRRYMTELEKHFVVVSWDQRGAGKSYRAIHPESSMIIRQFIYDTYELTRLLCGRFNQTRIYLAGHSWGSVLGVLTVERYPELYHAYIGIGQVADMPQNELLSYDWTLEQAEKAKDSAVVRKLVEIGRPPYSGNWRVKFITQRRYLGKYGGEFYGSNKGAFPVVFGSLIRASEYNLRDKVNFFRGILETVRLLGPELMTVNLQEQVPELKVPVYFFLGKKDHEAPSVLAEQYFKILKAPFKELIWFENSAHLPNIEENSKYTDLLINHVLQARPETRKTDVPGGN